MTNTEYTKYVDHVTPKTNCLTNTLKAFLTGGTICLISQAILNLLTYYGVKKDEASLWLLIILITTTVILTGFNLYYKITKFGGAGALVPITGFANSVAAPAIEYQTEGQVFGIGCKIFTICGPVILYGLLTSWILGIIYYAFTKLT